MSEQEKCTATCKTCKEAYKLEGFTKDSKVWYCNIYDSYVRVEGKQCYVGRKYINSAIAARQPAQSGKYYLVDDTLITAIGEWDKSPHNITKILELLRKSPIDFNIAARQQEPTPGSCDTCSKEINMYCYGSANGCAITGKECKFPDIEFPDLTCAICIEKQLWKVGYDAAIAQAAREDERKKVLDDDCNYRITTMIDGGSRVYIYPSGILPKQPVAEFEISKADREMLYKTIESLCVTNHTTNDRDYQCGDNCHGECSGEYDGKIHCPDTELEKKDDE